MNHSAHLDRAGDADDLHIAGGGTAWRGVPSLSFGKISHGDHVPGDSLAWARSRSEDRESKFGACSGPARFEMNTGAVLSGIAPSVLRSTLRRATVPALSGMVRIADEVLGAVRLGRSPLTWVSVFRM